MAKLADCVEDDVVMSAITLAELRYGIECRAADRTVQEDQVAALLEAVVARAPQRYLGNDFKLAVAGLFGLVFVAYLVLLGRGQTVPPAEGTHAPS